MKFGKRLNEDLTEVGWEDHYIRYRLLKKVIKVLSLIGDEGNGESLQEALTIFPRKKKILQGLSENENISCIPCKRWNIFSAILNDDIKHLQSFLKSTTQALTQSYYSDISPSLNRLLERTKQDGLRLQEPNLYPETDTLATLAKFAMFIDTIAALRRFIIVNDQALEKITKKFKKRVISSVDIDSDACGKLCARNLLAEFDRIDDDDSIFDEAENGCSDEDFGKLKMDNPQQTGFLEAEQLKLKVFAKIERSCSEEWDTITRLEAAAALLESKVMIECSTFHDFITDHKTQLGAQRQQEKLARVEARQRMLTRLTQHIDLENHARPATFLAISVVLPLLTLAVTYYISSTIYVDEEARTTVFDEKGYFISASIDRAPASNIGTLGLTTTLSLLSVIIFVKHKIVKKQLRGRNWMRTHRIATFFGLLSTFCGNGVAAFQHQFHATAHNTFAATFFLFGMIHVVLETIIDWVHSLSPQFTGRLRLFIAIVLIFCVTGFLAPMTYVLIYPEMSEQRLIFWKKVAAVFEVAAFGCFVIWFASYYAILKASQFKLHVQYRVRLDSSEQLTALRYSKHISRTFSTDSIDNDPTEDDSPVEAQWRSSPSVPFHFVEKVGLDLDDVEDEDDDRVTDPVYKKTV